MAGSESEIFPPRWEFRVWDEHIGNSQKLLQKCDVYRVLETNETYLLGLPADVNIKIRFDLLDIKQLLKIEANLELWTVALKADFPLAFQSLPKVFKTWQLPFPKDIASISSPTVLMDYLARSHPEIQQVKVGKKRHGVFLLETRCEWVEAFINGQEHLTISVEHCDAELVQEVVAYLGLANQQNMNYIEFLKSLTVN